MRILYKGTAPKKHKKALAAFGTGNYKLAKKEWEEIEDPLALKGLAFIALHESQYREARSFFEELLESAALDPEVRNGLALCYLAEGKNPEAIEVLLDAMDELKSPLLQTTLDRIRTSKGDVSLPPLMVITLPSLGFNPLKALGNLFQKMGWHIWWGLGPLLVFSVFFAYPYLRNAALNLDLRNRAAALPVKASIIGMDQILAARETALPPMDEETARQKTAQLRELISSKKPNRARILANEILASTAPEGLKERVYILEGFIAEPDYDNIDYTPSYQEISSHPSLYKGVVVRWEGMATKMRHQGRNKTSFELLIGYDGNPQVQGIAAVELAGMKELANGNTLTVVGLYKGVTPDNRVVVEAQRVLKQ